MSKFAIIPSNSPAESFPDNKTSDFTIPLSEPLDFPKDEYWKVGLLEAQIPITFYNIDEPSDRSIVFKDEAGSFKEKIPAGSYPTALHVVREINKIGIRARWFDKFFEKIIYIENIDTVFIRLKSGQSIIFPQRIATVLGFPEVLSVDHGKKTQYFKSEKADSWKNFHYLFIYSDLVEDSILNSSLVPLLGTVTIKNTEFGTLQVKSFLSPELLKPRYEHYSAINFQIRNEIGQTVRFRAGSVVLKLIFINAAGRNSSGIEK